MICQQVHRIYCTGFFHADLQKHAHKKTGDKLRFFVNELHLFSVPFYHLCVAGKFRQAMFRYQIVW